MKAFCVLILLGFVAVGGVRAQPASPPPFTNDSTNQLSVTLSVLPRSSEPMHAPATFHIFADVRSLAPANKGDSLPVNFFVDTNFLGSAKVTWHDGIRPDPHSTRPQPMIVVMAGFSFASMVWTNVPAGSYALTAQVTGSGVTAISEPVNITVQP
jgi:hypothetical protein